MNNKIKKQRRTAKQSKQEFTPKTRVYDLLKKEFHEEFKSLIEKIRPYVRDGDTIDWKHLRYFDFNDELIRKAEFIFMIAQFLHVIGKGDGLKCKMSVFIRYLASNEHANFELKYRSLNTQISRMLSYLDD
jgi:hypothetical protein